MALTEAVRLRLEGVGFAKLFTDHEEQWTKMAEEARKLIAGQVQGGQPTVDDIRKTLLPLVELHPKLRGFLAAKKLTQKYWIGDFTDYVLDKVYRPKLSAPKKEKAT